MKDRLYRRENGIFAFRYKDQRGRWREKYTGTAARGTARSFREKFLQELRDGIAPTEMADWELAAAERWWIAFRKPRISAATLNSERYRLQHFVAIFPGKRLRDITNADLEHYQNARLGEGISNSSVNKEIILWSLILKRARLWHRLREGYQPLANKQSDIGRAITREELRRLALVAETRVDWEAAFYGSVLAANTGLRGGEIKKLKIQAIDLSKRTIAIRRRDAKTNASARVVELNRDAVIAAERLLLRARSLGADEPQHFLMPKHLSRISHGEHKGERGHDPDQHQVCWDTAWKTLTVKAGLAPLRFHDLRHSFITHMVERGVPIGLVQAMVGHISARMLRHYTHVTSGASRRAVELFDDDPIFTSDAPPAATPTVSDGLIRDELGLAQDVSTRALPN